MVRHIDANKALYEVTYSVEVENNSDEKFESSLFVLDYFLGTMEVDDDRATFVKPLGIPPGRWNMKGQPGFVRWKAAGHYSSITSDAVGNMSPVFTENLTPTENAPMTGVVKPKDTLQNKQVYSVKAPTGGYIAFISSFCFDRCKNDQIFQKYAAIKLPG